MLGIEKANFNDDNSRHLGVKIFVSMTKLTLWHVKFLHEFRRFIFMMPLIDSVFKVAD